MPVLICCMPWKLFARADSLSAERRDTDETTPPARPTLSFFPRKLPVLSDLAARKISVVQLRTGEPLSDYPSVASIKVLRLAQGRFYNIEDQFPVTNSPRQCRSSGGGGYYCRAPTRGKKTYFELFGGQFAS